MTKDFAKVIDKVVEKYRKQLENSDDALTENLKRRLKFNSPAAGPDVWLSRASCAFSFAQRWAWRILLLYLLFAGVQSALTWKFESAYEDWQRSDLSTSVELTWNFLLRRISVLLGLPHLASLQRAAAGECMINNPLFRSQPLCCRCKFNVTVSKISNLEVIRENFDKILASGKTRLFLVINTNQRQVDFKQLSDIYSKSKSEIFNGYNEVSSLSGASVRGLDGLFADANEPPASSAVQWDFGHVEAVRHLRQLVERPSIVPPQIEVNLQRSLLFLGRQLSNETQVSLGLLPKLEGQVFAVALHGETVLTVKSNPECCKKPKNKVSKTVHLKPGRLMSLPSGCFVVTARRNGSDYSVVYFGSVPLAAGQQQQEEEATGKKKRK